MVFHTQKSVSLLRAHEARDEVLRYSNLCKVQCAVIEKYEKQLSVMSSELGAQHQIVLSAQAHLEQMKDTLFGKSTERRVGVDGLPLFDDNEPETEIIRVERKKRTEFGRTKLPELPRVEILHELTAAEMEAQGLEKIDGQFETSEQVNVIAGRYQVDVYLRQKYREKQTAPALIEKLKKDPDASASIVTAAGPLKLKDGGKYSIDFGIDSGLNKYSYHLPLDRQVRMMRNFGLICTSQVLFAQIDTIAWYLKNQVIPGIVAEIHRSRVNQADETWWENLEKDAKKRFWLWSVKSPRAVLFNVFDSRTKQVAKEFLGKLKGVLLTDGFYGYKCLASAELILANDWCHVRRKFVAAEKTHRAESLFFVNQIRLLFEIEKQTQGFSLDERQLARSSQARLITEAIYAKCVELKNVLPKSPLGKAIHYTLNLWKGLTVFLDHPDVPIHTNDIEREQRSPVLGRNNHKGSKSLKNAEIAAIWYTVIATCQHNGVNPQEYLQATLRHILSRQPVIMPWDWASRPQVNPPPT